jgi:hypothetical protein
MDLLQMLVSAANNLSAATVSLFMTLGEVGGIAALGTYLVVQATRARQGHPVDGDKVVKVALFCGALIALPQMINAAARQVGFGDVTFDDISYFSSSYGEMSLAGNAILVVLRAVGVGFFWAGLRRIKRANVDGHTGLSAREDVGRGCVAAASGLFLACGPDMLNALQATLQINW